MPEFKRAAIVSIKVANVAKIERLHKLRDVSEQIVKEYVNALWTRVRLPENAYKDMYISIPNRFNVSAKFLQILCQKASGMIRSNRTRTSNLKFRLTCLVNDVFDEFDYPNYVVSDGKLDAIAKLQRTIVKLENAKPEIRDYSLDLYGNCLKIDLNSPNKMLKTWITFNASVKQGIAKKSLAQDDFRKPIAIPFTPTKIFKRWRSMAHKEPTAVQFTKNGVMKVIFTIKTVIKSRGETEGCDIGMSNVWSLSSECSEESNNHAKTLSNILTMMFRRQKGTTAFRKLQRQRVNFTNWNINQLRKTLDGIKTLHIEGIQGMKKANDVRKHWSYAEILNKIQRLCEEQGIKVVKVCPRFTSQRCNKCGWVHDQNRKDKVFTCTKCKHNDDSDMNAAKNIKQMKPSTRIKGNNYAGFYFPL